MAKKSSEHKLPKPTAQIRTPHEGHPTPAEAFGKLCNPMYAGFGPYPALVDDEEWVGAAVALIQRDGAEEFLVNMLHMLRETADDGVLGPNVGS